MRNNQIHLTIEDNYRIVVIADIHGHLDIFKKLLKKVNLKPEDHLIILGDIINKGPDMLSTLRYIMELSKRENTYILKGNHEFFMCHYLYGARYGSRFLEFLQEDRFTTIVHETCQLLNEDLYTCPNIGTLIHWQMANYKAEYDFINNLPVIVYADNMIFVHGGYDDSIDIVNDEGKLLKFDYFNERSKKHDKTVIVGHWPTSILRTEQNTNLPYFNKDKNIISIDGGLGVKVSGELNALIIEKRKGHQTISCQQQNDFSPVTIKKAYPFHQEPKYFIIYPHFDVKILEKGEFMSKIRHVYSGHELSIFNSLLTMKNGKSEVVTNYINHFFNLSIGTQVELVKAYSDCALIKYKDEFGWVYRWQIED